MFVKYELKQTTKPFSSHFCPTCKRTSVSIFEISLDGVRSTPHTLETMAQGGDEQAAARALAEAAQERQGRMFDTYHQWLNVAREQAHIYHAYHTHLLHIGQSYSSACALMFYLCACLLRHGRLGTLSSQTGSWVFIPAFRLSLSKVCRPWSRGLFL